MRTVALAMALALIAAGEAFDQTLQVAEWFVDSDPGPGHGTPLYCEQSDSVRLDGAIALTDFGPGFHRLSVRFEQSEGLWGRADSRWFLIVPVPAEPPACLLSEAEWFLDADPGAGNGEPFALDESDSVMIAQTVDVTGLRPGFHRFSIRFRDSAGDWGRADSRWFHVRQATPGGEDRAIVSAEYFFDSDPGPGNGVALSVSASDSVAVTELIPPTGLGPGFHRLSVRFRDLTGTWGRADGRWIHVRAPFTPAASQPVFSAAEYFVDSDPGVGSATPLWPDDGLWDESEETISQTVGGYPLGWHEVGVRFRDAHGDWSITLLDSFLVAPPLMLVIHVSGLDVVLDWQPRESPMYYIYRADQAAGSFAKIDSTADTTYTHVGAIGQPGLRGFYRVTRAVTGEPQTPPSR
jgi:hypothetical protein